MQRFLGMALLAASISALNLCAPATAPAQTSSAAPIPPPAPAANGLLLRARTPVHLTFAQDLTSKTTWVGDPVVLSLDSDLKVDGVVVARAGSTAYAQVAKAEKAPGMGKHGELSLRLSYLLAGHNKVQLMGTEDGSATDRDIALTERFGPLGLIKHGNINIKQGTALMVYVANDTTLPPAR